MEYTEVQQTTDNVEIEVAPNTEPTTHVDTVKEVKSAIWVLYCEFLRAYNKKIQHIGKEKWEQVHRSLSQQYRITDHRIKLWDKKQREIAQELRKKESKYKTMVQQMDANGPKFFETEVSPLLEKVMQAEHILNIQRKEYDSLRILKTDTVARSPKMEHTIRHSVILWATLQCIRYYVEFCENPSELEEKLGFEEGDNKEVVLQACKTIVAHVKTLTAPGVETKESVLQILDTYGMTSFEDTEKTLNTSKETTLEIAKELADSLGIPYLVKQYLEGEKREESIKLLASQLRQGFENWMRDHPEIIPEEGVTTEQEKKQRGINRMSVSQILHLLDQYFFNDLIQEVEALKKTMKEYNRTNDKSNFYRMYEKRIKPCSSILWKDCPISELEANTITLLAFCGTTILEGWNLAILCF